MAVHVSGEYKHSKNTSIMINLQILEFKEDDIFIVYSPHLDLSGYGKNKDEARKSFEIAIEDFLSYTLNKDTFAKVLIDLGWKIRMRAKVKKPKAPSFSEMVANNEYLSEILDNHDIHMYQKPISMPTYA